MIKKLFPILLAGIAFFGGAAAGDMLAPSTETAEDAPKAQDAAGPGAAETDSENAGAGESGTHHAAAEPAPPAEGHGAAAAASETKAAPAGHGGAAAGDADKRASGHDTSGHGAGAAEAETGGSSWFKFPQQFFVPVLHDGELDSTMILSLSAEMPSAASETVFAHELKLRDTLLRQLLIQANTGEFDGNFTAEPQQRKLRGSLLTAAQSVVPEITDILIGDIARQER